MKTLILITALLFSTLAFAKPKQQLDPRIEPAKKASLALVQNHFPSIVKLRFIKTTILEQAEDFFLSNVVVSVDKVAKSYCLAFQVSVATDENGKPIMEIGILENNNDVMDVYIQECGNPPTTNDIAKLKALNNWINKD